jgi:hypothetical protein
MSAKTTLLDYDRSRRKRDPKADAAPLRRLLAPQTLTDE